MKVTLDSQVSLRSSFFFSSPLYLWLSRPIDPLEPIETDLSGREEPVENKKAFSCFASGSMFYVG